MAIPVQHRRDTAANWTSVDPVLLSGQMGIEEDTNKFKFGNGTDSWISLPYAVGEAGDSLPDQTGQSGKFLTTDGINPLWGTPAGSGDVVGPASAVDSHFAAFNTTTGKLIKDSGSKASDFEPANANIQTHIGTTTGNPHNVTKTNVGLGNVTNEAQIAKGIGTAKGDLIGYTATGAPARIPVGINDKVLTADSTQAAGVAWKDAPGGGSGTWGSITGTLSDQTDLNTVLGLKEATANKGAINGYAGLDSSGKVPTAQLPAGLPSSAAWSAVTGKPEITVGDTSGAYSTFAAAVGTLNTAGTPCTLIVPAGTHAVSSNLTANKNIQLVVKRGAVIEIAAGITLTIQGPFTAGRYKIFTDNSGSTSQGVKFDIGNARVNPEWWGADGTDNDATATVTTAAFNFAVNSLSAHGGTVLLEPGYYYTNGSTTLIPLVNFVGTVPVTGNYCTIDHRADVPIIIPTHNTSIKYLNFISTRNVYTHMIYASAEVTHVRITDNYFRGSVIHPWTYAIWLENVHNNCEICRNITFQCLSFLAAYIYDSRIEDNALYGDFTEAASGRNIWKANTVIEEYQIIRPTVAKFSQYCFQALATTGTWGSTARTGANEPAAWPDIFKAYGPYLARVAVTFGAHTIVRASGSWVDDGMTTAAGKNLIYLSGFPDEANNGFRTVTNVTASTLTVSESNTVNGTPASGMFSPTIVDNNVTWVAIYPPIGLRIFGANNQIAGNRIECFWAGISTGISVPAGGLRGGLTQSNIVNNSFLQNPGFGIYIGGDSGQVIENSTISSNVFEGSAMGIDGIWIDRGNPGRNSIVGNTFIDHLRYGLHLTSGTSYNSLRGNSYDNNGVGGQNDEGSNPQGDGSGTDTLPDQSGHDGQFLKTNGSSADWASVEGGSLPDQTGHNGQFLKTNGTTADWAAVEGGSGVWGSITGDIADQSDLQAALDAHAGSAGPPVTGTCAPSGAGTVYPGSDGSNTGTKVAFFSVLPTGAAYTITIGAPQGAWDQAEELLIGIADNGTAKTLSWDSIFNPIGVVLPTASIGDANKILYVKGHYNQLSYGTHTTPTFDVTGVGVE